MKIKKKEVQSEIFTGSMADISFLLIIYFMITSAFSADRGLDFALPEDTDTPEIKQEDSIDVHVLRGGAIEIDTKRHTARRIASLYSRQAQTESRKTGDSAHRS